MFDMQAVGPDLADRPQAAVFKWLVLFADDNGETQVTDRVLARYAFPEEWAEAKKADLEEGHDPETNREHDQHRDTLRSRARDCVLKMGEIGIVEVIGEDVVLDEDGNEKRVKGQPMIVKVRRIVPDVWKRFAGARYPVGAVKVLAGQTVVANMRHRGPHSLVEWGKAAGVYERIDRRTVWGNPFEIGPDGDRDEVIRRFREYLPDSGLLGRLPELRGKVLGCWCAHEACHGDVLKEAAA